MIDQATLLSSIIDKIRPDSRLIVALAGPPGSGKSTLGNQLHTQLGDRCVASTLVPMDGFHLDNAELDRLGRRARKGAPDTFDAESFVTLVKRVRNRAKAVEVPGFDRVADTVQPSRYTVTSNDQIVLVEGNYLLLKDTPWRDLHSLFDIKVMLNPGIEVLEQRLIQRWLDHNHTLEEARERALANDIPNAHYVLANSVEADYTITSSA